MGATMYEILSRSSVFKGMTPEQVAEVLQHCHTFTRAYGPGEMIALSGELCNHLMCIIEGSVKGEMVDYSGRVIKIEDMGVPRMLATAFIFGDDNRFPVNIMANENCRIFFIPKYDFLKLLQGNITILNNYLGEVSNRAQFLSNKIKFLSFKTIKGKLVQFLLKASRERDRFTLPMSQTGLSELFGVTRPALARVFHELAAAGIIGVDRREIVILDRKAMKALLRESR
jgi:CRP-like cAMP-binding protein